MRTFECLKVHCEYTLLQVPLHSLLFWREVQDYKALFMAPKFSPAAVQIKAKVHVYTQSGRRRRGRGAVLPYRPLHMQGN